jgi:RraA family protein
MAIGFRVRPRLHGVTSEIIAIFRDLPVATVSDSMARMFAAGPALRQMHGGGQLLGPAVTVRTRPGDNLMVHKALEMAEPGDVVVVDAGGDLTNAIIGELMVSHARMRGLGGIVIHGAIRDSEALATGDFPVFAAGVTHRGPYRDGPGEINTDISLGGMVIRPGDLIIGDADGVLCVPFDQAAEIGASARAKHAAEGLSMQRILARTQDKSWVDAALRQLGCEMPETDNGGQKQ